MFKSIIKIIIGALLVIGGIYWYFVSLSLGTGLSNWQALLLAVKSVFGAVVFLIGIFIVWLESDEIKVQREETVEQAQEPTQQDTAPTQEPQTEAEKIRSAVTTESSRETEGNQEQTVVCDLCGREFGSMRAVNIHKSRSH